ncbi:hypothetical protein [Actinopolyspora mortivallis]|uniref:Uncharacterized protein n=1 Tax=Actinopolyspora mortivallis TaxID=33906 RepID=A0A2T0GRW3_ACTMO|nr:hypothetical protein [Actinopolyspora mortivallis]PRW61783.1 hypothetical protein CEP50_18880 [Actinopolyspora mortivallis]
MGTVIDVVALLVTLVAVLVSAGHAGYLALMYGAARKRPGGEPTARFAGKRARVAGAALAGALLALLISSGGVAADVIAVLLGGASGLGSLKALSSTRADFHHGRY